MINRVWSLRVLFVIGTIIGWGRFTSADEIVPPLLLEPAMVHLRNKPEREWSDFPEVAEHSRLSQTFAATATATESCLMLRQVDVKESWAVVLNGKRLGELTRDENDITVAFAVPVGSLKNGENLLVIEASAKSPADDIRVGATAIYSRPMADVLSDSTLEVTVTDEESHAALPSRITIVDANGSLVPFGTKSNQQLAIRAGTIYTANGKATVKLPAGIYTVYAGRGFEYSLAQATIVVKPGEQQRSALSIRREVPTEGYVASDTHLHTLTHSGHGDCTIEERMITLAGEGIELPIATDHNVHIDYEPIARKLGVRKHFTPVMGNEVTTGRGHFNIFPIQAGTKVVDHQQTDWGKLFDEIYQTPGVRIAVLNHARDLHSGVRPFGPMHYNAVVAENLDGWPLRFNAMEVVNSGATQTDVRQLFRDWMGLLNHGYDVTPIGSSDSHDVARFIPGQGRTYIRCNDRDPSDLSVETAMKSLRGGRVMVSYGLLVEMSVDDKWASGDLAPPTDHPAKVNVRVLGPHWINADRVMLFANGSIIREQRIANNPASQRERGVIWQGEWEVDRRSYDMQLVALAMGPGIEQPYWRTAKPYQPTSVDPTTHVIGCSGAICLDTGDGERTPVRVYAERLVDAADGNIDELLVRLVDYDEATAAHVAHRLRIAGVTLTEKQSNYVQQIPWMKAGFEQYREACRANDIARATIKP